MKRPDTHKAGDLAENMVEQTFLQNNWVVNRQDSDYGFDLFVQYLEHGGGANSALIQVKALMSAPKWKDNGFKYRLERRYLHYWNLTPEACLSLHCRHRDIEGFFARNALHIEFDSNDDAKSVSIPFHEASELTENRFNEIVSEVRRWWAPLRFLKARYSPSGRDPADRKLITHELKGLRADQILTSDVFGPCYDP